jgi:hypothetical protein
VNRILQRLAVSYKALRQLGPQAMLQYTRYRFALQSGLLKRATSSDPANVPDHETAFRFTSSDLLRLPDREKLREFLGTDGIRKTLAEADEILAGQVRLFGGEPVPLRLRPPGPLVHWTLYERGRVPWGSEDVKLIWEPARFGWAFTLARAYFLKKDERYPAAFWKYTETFLDANPTNQGPNWASAQEAALRLMAFTFVFYVFADSPHTTLERSFRLGAAIAAHAARIPPTLSYARAQHNNHLLTEAAGLYTAGLALAAHPKASHWRSLGQHWLNVGLQEQIDEDGNYAQHSTNYHRLMLQTALWAQALQNLSQTPLFSSETRHKLAQAVHWLVKITDPSSGQVPNLGPNDGAYIFPLTSCPFQDYRPVIQAASQTFLNERPFSKGAWDEMGSWFNCPETEQAQKRSEPSILHPVDRTPHVLKGPSSDTWAYLRAARFQSRPGHADQLHLDLWWRGLNIAQDAGTFFYNAAPPWENALAHTAFHNTVTIQDQDQMHQAGRFLWLDWAQAKVGEYEQTDQGSLASLSVQHSGYQHLGVLHQRKVSAGEQFWLVEDNLVKIQTEKQKAPEAPLKIRLHWLVPDWRWNIKEDIRRGLYSIRIKSPYGWITIETTVTGPSGTPIQAEAALVRAGELLYGLGFAEPPLGWFSPTYAHKIPALSFSLACSCSIPLTFVTRWILRQQV